MNHFEKTVDTWNRQLSGTYSGVPTKRMALSCSRLPRSIHIQKTNKIPPYYYVTKISMDFVKIHFLQNPYFSMRLSILSKINKIRSYRCDELICFFLFWRNSPRKFDVQWVHWLYKLKKYFDKIETNSDLSLAACFSLK